MGALRCQAIPLIGATRMQAPRHHRRPRMRGLWPVLLLAAAIAGGVMELLALQRSRLLHGRMR